MIQIIRDNFWLTLLIITIIIHLVWYMYARLNFEQNCLVIIWAEILAYMYGMIHYSSIWRK